MTDGDLDHRYTIRLYLIRDQRPKYWDFHCVYCGMKLCELQGDLIYMTDITHDNEKSGMVGTNRIQCKGKFCRLWYEFSFN
jgi:hypothetical protein